MNQALKATVIGGVSVWLVGAWIITQGVSEIEFPVRGEKDGMAVAGLLLLIGLSFVVISLPLVIIVALGGSKLSWQVRLLGVVPLICTTIGLATMFCLGYL